MDQTLLEAINDRNMHEVSRLLASGVNPNYQDEEGESPLMLAAISSDIAVIRLLLKHGANIKLVDRYGMTALGQACWYSKEDAARLLLEYGYLANEQNSICTAMNAAAYRGSTQIVNLLRDAGAQLTLHDSVYVNDLNCARELLAQGVDIDAKNFQSKSALDIAIWFNHNEIRDLLLAAGAKVTLFDASMWGDTSSMKKVLAAGADVNAQDEDTLTPLMYAAWRGNEKAVELLLEHGARTDIRDTDGYTAMTYAHRSQNERVESLLFRSE